MITLKGRGDYMLHCKCCGLDFTESEAETKVARYHDEYWGRNETIEVEYDCCPNCGSDNLKQFDDEDDG